MNDNEILGSDVNNALHIRSGTTLRTDFGNLHSVDDKMSSVCFVMLAPQRDELKADAVLHRTASLSRRDLHLISHKKKI